jgi:hypothetical protein
MVKTDETIEERIAKLRAQIGQDVNANARRYDEDELGLSMASSDLRIRKCQMAIGFLEGGGTVRFVRDRLALLDGTIVEDARECRTRYGMKWRSDALDVWLPCRPARESTLANKGFQEVEEELVTDQWKIDYWAPRGARGTGGMTQVQVLAFPLDENGRKMFGWGNTGPVREEVTG